jgi:biopolymer transport protein ExbD
MRLEQPARLFRRRVNLTPLIDVVFILLMFFMLTSDLQQWRAMQLNVPAAQISTATSREPALLVRINADGKITLDGSVLTLDSLETRLRAVVADNPEQGVVVRPHPDVSVQRMVHIFDRLTASGVRKLTLSEP